MPIYVGPMVRFEGGLDVKPDRGGTLVLGSNSDRNLAFDGNEIVTRYAGEPSTLHLNWEGGAIKTGGPLVTRAPLLAGADVDLRGHDLWNVGRLDLGYTIETGQLCDAATNHAIALCPNPYKVIGGGCRILTSGDALTHSYPRTGPNGWACKSQEPKGCEYTRAYAGCADQR